MDIELGGIGRKAPEGQAQSKSFAGSGCKSGQRKITNREHQIITRLKGGWGRLDIELGGIGPKTPEGQAQSKSFAGLDTAVDTRSVLDSQINLVSWYLEV